MWVFNKVLGSNATTSDRWLSPTCRLVFLLLFVAVNLIARSNFKSDMYVSVRGTRVFKQPMTPNKQAS